MPLGGGIFVEFMRLPRTGELNSYLVYRDGMGDARVIAGAPESFMGGASGALEIDQPVETSRAAYGPANSPRTRQAVKLPTGERAPEEVWGQMTAEAKALRRTGRVDNVMGNTKVVNAINRGLLDNAGVDWQPYIGANKLSDMTGFDAASAEPVKQALRSARAPSQTEIAPEPPKSENTRSRREGSTVLKGEAPVSGYEEALDALGEGEGPWGFDDETVDEPKAVQAAPIYTGEPVRLNEPPVHGVTLGDAYPVEKLRQVFGEKGVPHEAFGLPEERVKNLEIPEDLFNGLLVQVYEAGTTRADTAFRKAVRHKIERLVGSRDPEMANHLLKKLSEFYETGAKDIDAYRRAVDGEDKGEDEQAASDKPLLPELPDTVSEEEIKKWLHGRESLVELFGLDPEQVKDIPKDKLDALLVQILNVRSKKQNLLQEILYKEAVKKKIYDTFSLRNPKFEARLLEELKYIEMDPNWMNYRYLSVEDLKKEKEKIKKKEPYFEIMDFAPNPASVIMSRGRKNQQKTLDDEFKKRGELPEWL